MFNLTKKQQNLFTKAICIVLAFVAIVGVFSIFGKDDDGYKTIHPGYSVGAISKTTGDFTEDECAIYTKDIIECTGIKLYADSDSDIKYTVHLYDEDEKWIRCVENEGLNLTLEELDAEETAVYGVRIVIYPQSDENEKVSFLEKGTYAAQLTVKITDKATKKAD